MERQADGSLQEGLRHRAPPGDHGRARPLPRRWPVLGRRLTYPPSPLPASSAVSSSWASVDDRVLVGADDDGRGAGELLGQRRRRSCRCRRPTCRCRSRSGRPSRPAGRRGGTASTMPSAGFVDCASVTSAPFGSVRSIHHVPPRLGEYVALVTVQPAGTPAGTSAGKPSAMAALTALLMIGEGTGSPLSVGESLGRRRVRGRGGVRGGRRGAGGRRRGRDRERCCRPRRRSHTPTTVTATSASPAMATGIRVMRQVCLCRCPQDPDGGQPSRVPHRQGRRGMMACRLATEL